MIQAPHKLPYSMYTCTLVQILILHEDPSSLTVLVLHRIVRVSLQSHLPLGWLNTCVEIASLNDPNMILIQHLPICSTHHSMLFIVYFLYKKISYIVMYRAV